MRWTSSIVHIAPVEDGSKMNVLACKAGRGVRRRSLGQPFPVRPFEGILVKDCEWYCRDQACKILDHNLFIVVRLGR